MRTIAFVIVIACVCCEIIVPNNCEPVSQNISLSCLPHPRGHKDVGQVMSAQVALILFTVLLIPIVSIIKNRLYQLPKRQIKHESTSRVISPQRQPQEIKMVPRQEKPKRVKQQDIVYARRGAYENTQEIVKRFIQTSQYMLFIRGWLQMSEQIYIQKHGEIEEEFIQKTEEIFAEEDHEQ